MDTDMTAVPHPARGPDLIAVRAALDLVRQLPDDLWPDFRPARIPLLVWDGEQSTLFGRADPPGSGWQAADGAWTLPHRHPALVANTAVTLEGELHAAAVLLESLPADLTRPELAALIVHEAFHVYQQTHRPERWQANELSAFGSPLSAEVLTTRRLETRALRTALTSPGDWPGHAAEALAWRAERRAHLTPEQQELERGLERLEGIAHALELRALQLLGNGRLPDLPDPDFAPEAIRLRTYSTGAALAALLDRTGAWKDGFMHGDLSLDDLLAGRLSGWKRAVTDAEALTAARVGAAADAEAVGARRQQARQIFLQRPGPRLVLRTAQPLWPQGFDPLNVSDLGHGEALHTRFLRFGNAAVSGEALGQAALTLGAGPHPLMNGFSVLTATGLQGAEVQAEADRFTLSAPGLRLEVRGPADLEAGPDGWTLRLA